MKKLLLFFTSIMATLIVHAQPCAFSANHLVATGGLVNFTTNNPAATPGITYTWNFGDATAAGSGASPSHTYAANGNYTVTITSTAPTPCTSTITIGVSITNVPANCTGNNAAFTHTVNLNTGTFTNTSPSPTAPNLTKSYVWMFGDNTTAFTTNATHVYASNGTYNVSLVSVWRDTISSTFCYDTVRQPVVIANQSNIIKGYVVRDSTSSGINDNYKVWLIVKDATTTRLRAVDSVTVGGPSVTLVNGFKLGTAYTFNNVPVGTFYLKAARTSTFLSALSAIPTYYDSTYYWGNAGTLTTTGAMTYSNTNIVMRQGTGITGAGFISGNINKASGAGVSNVTVLLSDAITQTVLRAALTNAAGDYSFTGIPGGTYSVYPENMNYATTPNVGVNLTGAQPNASNVNFIQDDAQFTIKPRTTSVIGVSGNSGMRIYPNPASDKIVVQMSESHNENLDISITEVTGKLVVNKNIGIPVAKETIIDISALNPGVYFIKVNSKSGQWIEKMIIQH